MSLVLAPQAPAEPDDLSIAQLQQRIAASKAGIVAAEDELVTIARAISAARKALAESRETLEDRAVSLYVAGDQAPIVALAAGGSIDEVVENAEALERVADADIEVVERHTRVAERIPQLQERAAALNEEIDTLTEQIAQDREAIVELEEAARRAREQAALMARQQQIPLTPTTVSPAAVMNATADQIEDGASMQQRPPEPPQPAGYTETGVASVYSDSFTGQTTASGGTYDPGAMTAAHPSLPFGTYVTVAGPGGSAVVLINDRGPFVGGRVIDLSRAAAAAVGVNGLATVTLTVAN